MDDRERQICRRVRDVRLHFRQPQLVFARIVSLTRDKLAAIELECSPLRFAPGNLICEKFDVCQRWLAEGLPQQFGCIQYPLESLARVDRRELFSVAYFDIFREFTGLAVERSFAAARGFELYKDAGGSPEKAAAHYAELLRAVWFSKLSVERQEELFRWLMGAAGQFHQVSHSATTLIAAGPGGKNVLTEAETSSKDVPVKAQLPSLLERLKKATAATGKKTELAEFLKPKVPLASVSRWLSGEREPGGEVTLQLLYWVELQERNAK